MPDPLPAERLPNPSSVLAQFGLTPASGAAAAASGGSVAHYRILRTLEVDEYEDPVVPADIVELAAPQAPPTDNAFRGTSRKAAKLSVATAETESFEDLQDLIDTLEDHEEMVAKPNISTDKNNNRIAEELRNVKVVAFLYAASREDDNDYHLIIGRDPSRSETYMTVEISGLPPSSSQHFGDLNGARSSYFNFFGNGLPGTSYDFYDPPIPVEIEGSLFFDMSHATGGRPGPSRLRPHMPVVWEIHPITKIVLEP